MCEVVGIKNGSVIRCEGEMKSVKCGGVVFGVRVRSEVMIGMFEGKVGGRGYCGE